MITPGKNYVSVKRINIPKTSDGGLHLPDDNGFISSEGIIEGVGKDNKDGLKQGDHIVFVWSAGFEFKLNNETILIMKHDDVLGVLDADAKLSAHHREF